MVNFVFFIILLVVGHVTSFDEEPFSVEAKLINDLLSDYNPQISPILKQRLNISLSMTLSQIISVKAKSQELTTSSYLSHAWYDTRLNWEPAHYENIRLLRLPAKCVWKPRLLLENSKDGSFDISLNTNVLVWYNGSMEWLPPALYKSSCTIKIAMFPFDEQVCDISLIYPTFHGDEMQFILGQDFITIDPGAYQDNGEWHLKKTSVRLSDHKDGYLFSVYIKRKPQFYIINIIIPCMLLSSLSCLVFYLPSCSCEKFTLATSILLGQTVFFFLIAQRTPETSMAVPVIGGYIMFLMTLVVFSLVTSVMICNINFRSNNSHEMPYLLRWFFMEIMAPILKVERPDGDDEDEEEEKEAEEEDVSSRMTNPHIQETKFHGDMKNQLQTPSQSFFEEHAGKYNILTRTNKQQSSADSTGRIGTNWTPPPILSLPPAVWSTFESICYVAKRKKQEEVKSQSQDDWSYLALILDRLLLWIYCFTFVFGSFGFSMKSQGY